MTEGTQKTQEAAEKTKERAKELGSQAQEQAKEMSHKAEHQAKSMLEQRKGMMANELNSVAQAFRETGGQLRQQNRDSVAQYSDRVADQVEKFSGYLQDKEIDTVVNDAEDLARRQPELFLGAAFGVGLLVARFFKSGGDHEQRGDGRQQRQSTSYMPTRSPRSLPERDATTTLGNR